MEVGFLSMGFITIISHIISIAQLYRMLTQVRAKKRGRERMASLEIHPEIQVKLQLNRVSQNKHQGVGTGTAKEEKKQERVKVSEIKPTEEQSFKSFLKYQSLPSPPGRSRKSRPSSYQLYKQQQKTLRETHYTKINEWKTKLLTTHLQKDKSSTVVNTFNRTGSFSEGRSLHNRQITMPFHTLEEVVAIKPIEHPSFRSSYIKTSEGRRKMVDNNTYLRKLKARIEFYSLSAIITERHNLKIKVGEGATVQAMKQEQSRGAMQESKLRNYIKYGKTKMRARNGSNADVQGCRPWSGFKEDFANELSSLV